MDQPSVRAFARPFLVAAAAALVLSGAGCGSKGGGVADLAEVDACVLQGATTNDGCNLVGGAPGIALGDLTIGAVKTVDVALYDGGGGGVPATVSAIGLQGATANYSIVKIFTLDASRQEVAATLPFDLSVNHGNELRVRVSFTADVAAGPVSGASLQVVASHPQTSVAIPIAGQVTGCPAGRGDCDNDPTNGCEVDLQTSMQNCGACGAACGTQNATSTCVAGSCQISCNAGYGNCDGSAANGCETDLLTDAANCSACGTACNATNGTPACNGGTCGISCAPGYGDCDGNPANGCEANLSTDAANCGACGTSCGSVNGTGACSAGLCVESCNPGFGNCDAIASNGCETDLSTSVASCGACGVVCNATNGTPSCVSSSCQIACNAGFANCDGLASNGCEVNTTTDPANCGGCGTVCNATNGTPTCASSVCGITCNAGFANCDGLASNGCEVSTATDPNNCGGCGTVCNATNGTATCTSSTCGITCNAGYANCDGLASNGCEVNLNADVANCGACALACGTANATPSCTSGTCALSCNAGWADCDGLNADGCETNLLVDPASCGACGNVCVTPNATPACAAGACVVGACNAGYADCDGLPGDGCEVNLQTDPNNCGACGNVCSIANGTAACVAGQCAVATCNAGYADCDGNPANGCEVNVQTDPNNCGACGTVCTEPNATAACSGGACAVGTCNAGWGNCDGLASNGCETSTATDVNNCGACGNLCALANATAACTSSTCQIASCNPNYYDMDGIAADGCECTPDTYSQTCAAPTSLGTLVLGQTVSTSGNLVPGTRVEYFSVTFTNNANYSYHPKIALTTTWGGARFDVLSDCSGTPAGSCGVEGGTSLGIATTWETFYTGGDPSNPLGLFQPIPPPGNAGTVLIRVYTATSTTTCGPFTLTVSN